ncbi:MAG TPA: glycosyltransferase [Bryobacteraceae bacterium]|nr:glycosyltransferase [Bryobacteraceae bacterium]
MTVLSVAYPLAPVRDDTAGGAEQVLAMLDRALTNAGHHSVVVAAEGSRVAGTLVATPRADGTLDKQAEWKAQAAHRNAIERALQRWPVDLIHFHGQDFAAYQPARSVPAVVTLHVPRAWYGAELPEQRPEAHFVCVSEAQRQTWPQDFRISAVIENGVDANAMGTRVSKRRFALWLGRVSPEKGTAIALDAAQMAGTALLVAGEVYAYEAHKRYFQAEVLPRLNSGAGRFIGPAGFARKRRLLTAARCLVITSQAEETSSLVAMEALACGTPVVTFPAGALRSIVEHGRTGFVASTVEQMAEGIRCADEIDPAVCRAEARERFPAARMAARYVELYAAVARRAVRWTA